MEAAELPKTVRYIKNGESGKWWKRAKEFNQVHAGWNNISGDLLKNPDWSEIESLTRQEFEGKPPGVATTDLNQLRYLIERPSQHIWVTVEENELWWCTVKDKIEVADVDADGSGHFWLTCDRPWSNTSIKGRRLRLRNLPGPVGVVAGFRATVCTPRAANDILRVLNDQEHESIGAARKAQAGYEESIREVISQLNWKDFELLTELILARSGWARVAELGKTVKSVDIQAHNPALNQNMFVQVKSQTSQSEFNECYEKFLAHEDDWMVFAFHKSDGPIHSNNDTHAQIWDGEKLAQLVVSTGLAGWLTNKI